MAVITISREIGSGGDEVARQVCEVLRYRYFDKHLLVDAAAEVGLTKEQIIDYTEEHYEVKDLLSRLLRRGARPVHRVEVRQMDASGREAITEQAIDEVQYVAWIKSAVRAAYDSGDIVIVGRGSQAVLQDRPLVLHVRIVAPMATRLRRLQHQHNIDLDEAQRRIERQDRATAEYLGRFFGVRWDDPLLYHVTINTGKVGIEGATQLIVDGVVQLRAMSMA